MLSAWSFFLDTWATRRAHAHRSSSLESQTAKISHITKTRYRDESASLQKSCSRHHCVIASCRLMMMIHSHAVLCVGFFRISKESPYDGIGLRTFRYQTHIPNPAILILVEGRRCSRASRTVPGGLRPRPGKGTTPHISGGRAGRPVSEARAFLRPRRFERHPPGPRAGGGLSVDRSAPTEAAHSGCSVNVRA